MDKNETLDKLHKAVDENGYPSGPDDDRLMNLSDKDLRLLVWAYSNEVRVMKEDMQEGLDPMDQWPLLWVVDVWQSDDYRMQDAFFFICHDEAMKFAEWTVKTDQDWKWPQNSIYPIRPHQIKTLEENTKDFLERYGDDASGN